MTFASGVKNEILHTELKKNCCALAEFCGILCFCGSVRGEVLRVVTENLGVLERFSYLLKRLFGVSQKQFVPAKTGRGGKCCALEVSGADFVKNVLSRMGSGESVLCPSEALVEKSCCRRAFCRGAFLGGGSVSAPERGYHLEFVTRQEPLTAFFCRVLESFGLAPKTVKRKGNDVVYFKSSEEIEEILNIISAHQSMMDFFNLKIIKDKRNEVNRQVNCDSANLDKALDAARAHCRAISVIEKKRGLSSLPENLQEMARVRLAHPEATLLELSALLGISKSGVNHRLKKLVELAGALEASAPGGNQ